LELLYKDSSISVEPPDEKGFIEGYASVYGVVDRQNERTMPGAFAKAVAGPRKIKLLWQHKFDRPIGKVTKLWEDERGLRFRGKLNLKTDWGRNAYEALLAGDLDSNSIGYNEIKGKNAINVDDGVKDLYELELHEISVVSFPSNEAATVDEVKSSVEELETKTTIPYKRTALAPEGQAWDGPAQVSGASVEQLRAMCACIDGDPANNTSYKLPHHMKSGSCVWAGVRAAYAATQGARTGQSGVQGCGGAESHLLKHYDDFDKPRPGKADMDDLETKETKQGRVLSTANETKLRQANDLSDQLGELIESVLESVTGKPETEPADTGPDVSSNPGKPGKYVDELLIKRIQRIKEILE